MNRTKIKDSIKSDIAAYYPYLVQEGERPDILSFRYYGSVSYAYLILLFNNIIDPQFDWPLNTIDFENYIGQTICYFPCTQFKELLFKSKRLFVLNQLIIKNSMRK